MTEGTERINALSDGVFAIAVTLLILEIKVPHIGAGERLWPALVALWPSYAAFGLSFFVILVTWIAHHDLMRLVRGTNIPLQIANGAALAYVTFIPFPTAVLADSLGGPNLSTAVALYCGTFVLGSTAFNILAAVIDRGHLVRADVDPTAIGRIRHGYRVTLAIYIAATLIALASPYFALLINVAVRLHLLRVHHISASLPRPEGQTPESARAKG
jgi:uncharacterized membrane protein